MKLLPLTRGKFAQLDDEDFERCAAYKWRYKPGHKGRSGYGSRTIRKDGKRIDLPLHRFILETEASQIDHKDGNGLNCQRYNLRPCSRTQNQRNRNVQSHSTPYKGVHRLKSTGQYQSRLAINGVDVHLGTFETAIAAAQAYDCAAAAHFGEFAKTNQQLGAL